MVLLTTIKHVYGCGGSRPTADFNVDNVPPVVVGQSVLFTDASSNNPTEWTWSFGSDASPANSNNQNPTTIYTSEGTKVIRLTATNRRGSSVVSKSIYVNCNAPIATISPDPATVTYGSSLNLNGNPSGGSGTYTTHAWSGPSVTYLNATDIQNPTFTGAPVGTYSLTYTVTDQYGCVATDNITITVNPKYLTFTAGDQTVAYSTHNGTILQNGTYTISGFENGDNSSVISGLGSVAYNTNYTNTTNAGSAGVTITPVVSGLSTTNYTLVAATGDITITKADQFISYDYVTFTKPLNEFNTIPIEATSSSGLSVTITIVPGSAAFLNGSIGGYYLTDIELTGTVTIYANQAGDINYNPAAQATLIFDVTKSNQNISFPGINDINYYNELTLNLEAQVSSGLNINYTVVSGPAIVSGSTLSITGTGEIQVMASQPGNSAFNSAPDVIQSFAVGKGTQTISINIPGETLTESTQITATSTSGLPVTLTLGTGSAATSLINHGGYYTLIGIGSSGEIYIAGNQAGNTNYMQAPQVVQTIEIGKTNQTISFNSISNQIYSLSLTVALTATASSTYTVSYSVSGPASISASTLTITGAGTVIIQADQNGNATYNAAPTVTQQFEVEKATPAITLDAITKTYGDVPFTISPTSASNGTFSFISANTGIYTISGSTATIVGTGTTDLNITQQPTANYTGTTATVSLTVNKASSTIAITGKIDYTYNGTHQGSDISTVTGSLGTVTYSYIGTGGSTTFGPTSIKPINAGNYSATATVAENDNYSAATSALFPFTISKANPTISVTPYSGNYNGLLHTSVGAAIGVNGEALGVLDLSGTTHTDAGTYNDSWAFTDITENYNNITGNVNNRINEKGLTITASDQDKCFGATFAFAGTEFTSSGLQNSEMIGSVTLASSGALPRAIVGDHDIVSSVATGGTFNPANYSIAYNNGTMIVKELPSLTGATQATTVCDGSSATINLTGLLPNKTFSLEYSINGTSQATQTGIVSNSLGESSFSTPVLSFANNEHTLSISELIITSQTPNCNKIFMQDITLRVNPLPTLSTVSQAEAVCEGSQATINLSGLVAGTTFSVGYRIDGVDQTPVTDLIANSSGNSSFNTPSLTIANNGQILQLFGIAITSKIPECVQSFTQNLVLDINPTSIGGTVSTDQTICSGISPANISLLGETGTIRWQVSTNNTSFTDISGAISSPLTGLQMGSLIITTYYRARVTSGSCAPVYSNTVSIAVNPEFTPGAIETIGETICSGSDPALIGSTTIASGGDGTIIYEWQANGTAIESSNFATYNPPSGLTSTTTFSRFAKDNTCNTTFKQSTGSWIVTVNSPPSFTTCPKSNITKNVDNGACSADMSYTVTGAGIPAPYLTYSFTGATTGSENGTGSGSTFNIGLTNVTITANNGCSPDAICSFSVTVVDNELPSIICATPSASYSSNTGECFYTVPDNNLDPTATGDNCEVVSVINDFNSTNTLNGSQFPVGTTTVTWTVTDASGNFATCQYDVVVTSTLAPTVTIVANANPICAGGSVTFTATPTNEGANPNYHWKLNESNVGANQNTYTNSLLANGDVVTCVLTSSLACAINNPATSNAITITVNTLSPPTGITTSASPVCSGTEVTLSVDNPGVGFTTDWFTESCGGIPVPGGIGVNSLQVTPTTTTTYYTQTRNGLANCISTGCTSIEVIVTDIPTATISGDATICVGSSTPISIVFTGNSPWEVTTLHNGGDPITITNISVNPYVFNVTAGGEYTISAFNDAVCDGTFSGSATVTENTLPSFTVCPTDIVANTASGACTADVSYTVTATGSPTPTLTYTFTGQTTGSGSGTGSGSTFNLGVTNVTVTASNDCTPDAICSFAVTVNPDNPIDIEVEDLGNSCQSGETGSTTEIIWNINKLAGTDNWTYDYNIKLGALTVASGTGDETDTQISYQATNETATNKTYTITITNVKDNCGVAEINTGNNSDSATLFGVPAIGSFN